MDLLTYDAALPELPLLKAFPRAGEPPAPAFDWAAYVIRLAKVMAGEDRPRRQAD